jgi:hypothetical protein
MQRAARSGLRHTILAAGAAVLLGACGTASTGSTSAGPRPGRPPQRPQRLTVSPTLGAPTTAFVLHFIVPALTGVSAGSRRTFELGVSGPQRAGCIASRSVGVPSGNPGARVDVTLDPAKLGGRWCAGAFVARIDELQQPACSPGMMCPQFVRVIGTVGRVRFRVVAAA